MADGRRNNGGNKNAGRKSKAEEERIRGLSISGMKRIWGSEEKAFEFIAEKAQESFPHLKLLIEYAYGKPKEYYFLDGEVESKHNIANLTTEEILMYKNLNAKARGE